MPVPTALTDLSATAASNSPAGSESVGSSLDDYLRGIQAVLRGNLAHKGADIASATTTDLGAVVGLFHDITGTTTITGFGTVSAGVWKVLKFEGALTLTHNATSLILPGAANITTADGDVGIFVSEGSGNWRCVSYLPAAAGSVPFVDSSAVVMGSSDKTKKIRFEVDGLTTATTRVITVTDENFTIGARGGIMTFMANATVADGSTNYMSSSLTSTAEADVSVAVPFACTVKNLFASRSAGGAGTAAFTLRKNGGDTSLTAAPTGAGTTASDTSNSVSFAAGDLIDIKVVLSGGATTAVHKASVEIVKT